MKPIISAFMCTNRTLQRSRADLLQEKFVHIGSAHKCPGEVLSLATTNAHDNLSEIEEYSKMSHGKGDIISAIKEHIDIPDYLESCGYHIRKHGSKGKLTLKEHDSFVYDPARKRFYWNSRDLEGDIVDLYSIKEFFTSVVVNIGTPVAIIACIVGALFCTVKAINAFHSDRGSNDFWRYIIGIAVSILGIVVFTVLWTSLASYL